MTDRELEKAIMGAVLQFGTKAETLENLRPHLTSATILPQIHFTVDKWRRGPDAVLAAINAQGWGNEALIVRSSATDEDSEESSQAGRYQSILDVRGRDALRRAVEEVIASFGREQPEDQVLVQPFLTNAGMSGVAFSRDLNTGAPYIIINYDDQRGTTDSVTSGRADGLKTFICWRGATGEDSSHLAGVVALVREVERYFDNSDVDIEFAFDQQDELYLLQARPLIGVPQCSVDLKAHGRVLSEIERKIGLINRPHPYLHGKRTVFGVMPDWNPAEIIGTRPRPLALSLYRELITDTIWAYQRNNYGYKNLRSFPLLVSFHGLPYIDVRVSFNSFIPRSIEGELADRMVDYYVERLLQAPVLHDKVEFEIIYSCYTLDLPQRLDELKDAGFSETEVRTLTDQLRTLTKRIIYGKDALWRRDREKVMQLEGRIKSVLESKLDRVSRIYWLLEDCKRYGTLPFAGLARAGFVAVQLLRSLVNVGILNDHEYNIFFRSLNTIQSKMAHDFRELDRQEFLRKYGHLRPGTYDIRSPRYDEAPDTYFDWSGADREQPEPEEPFALSLTQMGGIRDLLREHQLEDDVVGMFEFLKEAIEGREHAKYLFTRSLSEALTLFKSLGSEYGLSSEDCSFADISCIYQAYATSADLGPILQRGIDVGRENYEITKSILLPPLMGEIGEVRAFHQPQSQPNFITQGSVTAPVTTVERTKELRGTIVLIPSADPGYDWIFSQEIAGFVTEFGGANSHMAIRASELGLPAIIGAGPHLFDQWSRAMVLRIDCANRLVEILR